MAERLGKKKRKLGIVVSNKMDKTVVVEVARSIRHPMIGKVIQRISRFKAHDEKNACKEGDRVLIVETRPVSSNKCWRVAQVLGVTRQ
jgi:small subunit ribosomal protein S17